MARNSFSKLSDNGNLKIEAYSLVDFLQDFQEAINNGFMLDLESNEHYPQSFGSMIHCVLVPAGDVVVQDTETEPVTVEPVTVEELVVEPPETADVPVVPETEPKVEAPKTRKTKG
jgi:hypothetical protein